MQTVNIHEAKTHFSRLIEQAHAGQEIVVAKAGVPYARLVPLAADFGQRQAGRLRGQISTEGILDPLPSDELAAWEGT
jgi:prevent-host-death family protein